MFERFCSWKKLAGLTHYETRTIYKHLSLSWIFLKLLRTGDLEYTEGWILLLHRRRGKWPAAPAAISIGGFAPSRSAGFWISPTRSVVSKDVRRDCEMRSLSVWKFSFACCQPSKLLKIYPHDYAKSQKSKMAVLKEFIHLIKIRLELINFCKISHFPFWISALSAAKP